MNRIRPALIAAFCLLALVPLLVIGLFFYISEADDIRRDQEDTLAALRDKKAALVELWLRERLIDAQSAAASALLQGFLAAPSTGDVSAVRSRLADFARGTSSPYHGAYLVSAATGQIVASTSRAQEGLPAPAALKPLLQGGQDEHLGATFCQDEPRHVVVAVAVPTQAPGRARPLGAVVLEPQVTASLTRLVGEPSAAGRTGEVELVDNRLHNLLPLRHGAQAPFSTAIRAVPAQRALGGSTGLVWTEDYRGVPVVAAYTRIPHVNWGLVVKKDQAEVNQPVARLGWLLLAVGGGALVVAAAVGVALASRLTRPLEALAAAARRHARGEHGVRVPSGGAYEVAETADAFNFMSQQLDTAREELEEHARQEEERADWLATVIDQVPVGVVIAAAPDGRLIAANKAAEELWGMPMPEVRAGDYSKRWSVRRPNGELVAEDELPLVRALRRGEQVIADELVVGRAGGGQSTQLITAAPLRVGGKVTGAVAAFWDVTAERETQRQLEEASRLKDEFLSMASHELKTPVTSIKIFADLVAKRPEAVRPDLVRRLSRQADQLSTLINDLLDVSRLQIGKMPVQMQAVNLRALLQETCARREGICDDHVLSCPEDGEPVNIAADPVRLEQVFSNLLDNAHKYTPAGCRIWVRLSHQARRAVVEVADEGIGIPPEHLPHVFERFYKPGPQQAVYAGLGVGLYISKEIVERHGGRIWAESEGEGRGSSFFVELPLAQEPA